MQLKVAQVCGDSRVFRDDGLKLRREIEHLWSRVGIIEIDFENIRIASASFLDEGIAMLALVISIEDIKRKVRIRNITDPDKALLNQLILSRAREREAGAGRYELKRVSRLTTKLSRGAPSPSGSEYVLVRGGVEERSFATEAEATRWAANSFKKWRQSLSGTRKFPNDRTALLAWVLTEGLVREYGLFEKLADALAEEGLATRPAPPADQFISQVKAFERDNPS